MTRINVNASTPFVNCSLSIVKFSVLIQLTRIRANVTTPFVNCTLSIVNYSNGHKKTPKYYPGASRVQAES